jgi:hypothetical protein
MPSRADRFRRRAELALRVTAIAAGVALVGRAWPDRAPNAGAAMAGTAPLDSALALWTRVPPQRAFVRAPLVPSRREREWLVALRRTGTAIAWSLPDSAAPVGLTVEPVPGPSAASRLTVATPPGATLRIADGIGLLDSARAGLTGGHTLQSPIHDVVGVRSGAARAAGAERDSLVLRPVLVLGRVGWESKFVTAALEEDGWTVRARLIVAPGAVVEPGGAAPIDTSRLAAVVVLDSVAFPDAAVLRRFVEQGGGLVIGSGAAPPPAVAAFTVAATGTRRPGLLGALQGPAPREGLAARTWSRLGRDAVPLEERAGRPVVVGRRVGAGRVLLAGYEDTWRWRMLGASDDAPANHRAWWSAAVAAVAHAPLASISAPAADGAPLAAAVEALGAPAAEDRPGRSGPSPLIDPILFALFVLTLLAEWSLRRLRGAP